MDRSRVGCCGVALGWVSWGFAWQAERPGPTEICCLATDATGDAQPVTQDWNMQGTANNAVQRIRVRVRDAASWAPAGQ